jgi:hypothetical protein
VSANALFGVPLSLLRGVLPCPACYCCCCFAVCCACTTGRWCTSYIGVCPLLATPPLQPAGPTRSPASPSKQSSTTGYHHTRHCHPNAHHRALARTRCPLLLARARDQQQRALQDSTAVTCGRWAGFARPCRGSPLHNGELHPAPAQYSLSVQVRFTISLSREPRQ